MEINKNELIEVGHQIYSNKNHIQLGTTEGVYVERTYYISLLLYNKSKETITLSKIDENYKFELLFETVPKIENDDRILTITKNVIECHVLSNI